MVSSVPPKPLTRPLSTVTDEPTIVYELYVTISAPIIAYNVGKLGLACSGHVRPVVVVIDAVVAAAEHVPDKIAVTYVFI